MNWFKKLFSKKTNQDSLKQNNFVRVERYIDDGIRTIGKMFIDDKFACYTLEDTFRKEKIKHQTRIPSGVYKLALRYSPKFSPKYKHDLIWLKDVPNFEWILIHVGNTEKDTSGCILVGTETIKDRALRNSKVAYSKIYPLIASKIKSGADVRIEIVDLCR